MKLLKWFVACMATGLLTLATLSPVAADSESPHFTSTNEDEGFTVEIAQTERMRQKRERSAGERKKQIVTKVPEYHYRTFAWNDPKYGCNGRAVNNGFQNKQGAPIQPLTCATLHVACENNPSTPRGHFSYLRKVLTATGTVKDVGRGNCSTPGSRTKADGTVEATPVVTLTDFEKLDVTPLKAHLGPASQWVKTGGDNIVWAEAEHRTITRSMLGHVVTIRAIPTTYVWTFGDGTTLTTTFPGRPYPHRDIAAQYRYEGWYEMSLSTEFAGEYSVDGGPFIPINGTIMRTSPKRWIYSETRTARLVSGPVDQKKTEIPARTKDTLGTPNEDAVTKHLTRPGENSVRQETRRTRNQ